MTNDESSQINDILSNQRSGHIEFRGQVLKVIDIEVLNAEEESGTKTISDYSTEEIKSILGSFEDDRKQSLITLTSKAFNIPEEKLYSMSVNERNSYYIKIGNTDDVYEWIRKKMNIDQQDFYFRESLLSELQSRRGYAERMDKKSLEKLTEKMTVEQVF